MADPWKRYRLLAYIVVMLALLIAGLIGYLTATANESSLAWHRVQINPLSRLHFYCWLQQEASDGRLWLPDEEPANVQPGTYQGIIVRGHDVGAQEVR